jgi:hypothetical protein
LKITRFALAALAAMAFLLVVNVALYPVVFPAGPPQLYQYERAEPLALYHVLAMFVVSLLLAYVFPLGYRGKTPWAEGLRFGMLMGVLISLPASLNIYAMTNIKFAGLLTVVLWSVITHGVAGTLIGVSYGKSLQSGGT